MTEYEIALTKDQIELINGGEAIKIDSENGEISVLDPKTFYSGDEFIDSLEDGIYVEDADGLWKAKVTTLLH